MSLLSDDEILSASQDHFAKIANVRDDGVEWDKWAKDFARAVEAAILAKLASAELPEPEKMPLLLIGAKHSYENVGERSFTEADFYSAAIEIFKLGQSQAYAQGAASQLAQEAEWFAYRTNGAHWFCFPYKPHHDAYDEGTLPPLFTLKEPK